ncbi:transposase [Gloeomargarita sp.]
MAKGKERFAKWLTKAHFVYGKILPKIRTHLHGLCNCFIRRTTSGVMAGRNNCIKLIKKQAYSFLSFDHFRARTLAAFSEGRQSR